MDLGERHEARDHALAIGDEQMMLLAAAPHHRLRPGVAVERRRGGHRAQEGGDKRRIARAPGTHRDGCDRLQHHHSAASASGVSGRA